MNTIWEVYEYYMPYVEVNTYREGFYARLLGVWLLESFSSKKKEKKLDGMKKKRIFAKTMPPVGGG